MDSESAGARVRRARAAGVMGMESDSGGGEQDWKEQAAIRTSRVWYGVRIWT